MSITNYAFFSYSLLVLYCIFFTFLPLLHLSHMYLFTFSPSPLPFHLTSFFPLSVLPSSLPHHLSTTHISTLVTLLGPGSPKQGLTDRYEHRYKGSEMDSKPCRLADRQTCSHKTSKMRERGSQTHGRTRQLADLT